MTDQRCIITDHMGNNFFIEHQKDCESGLTLKTQSTPFITKDSGERQEYASGMRRDTSTNKPQFQFLLWPGVPYAEQFITRCAALMARGADKYGAWNFTKANSEAELARFKESALRHMLQWACDEEDEDHAAAIWYNVSSYVNLQAKLRHQHGLKTNDGKNPLNDI